MEFIDVIKERYTCRSYDGRPVEEEKIKHILEVANHAPSALNHQSLRVYIIKSENGLKTINELCSCIRGSTTVFLYTYNKEETFVNPKNAEINSGVQDVSVFAVHVMLAATEIGVNTSWINFFDPEEIKKAFRLPANETPVLLMPMGYADEEGGPNPVMHNKRKQINNLIQYL